MSALCYFWPGRQQAAEPAAIFEHRELRTSDTVTVRTRCRVPYSMIRRTPCIVTLHIVTHMYCIIRCPTMSHAHASRPHHFFDFRNDSQTIMSSSIKCCFYKQRKGFLEYSKSLEQSLERVISLFKRHDVFIEWGKTVDLNLENCATLRRIIVVR